jgi:hypothetical protein
MPTKTPAVQSVERIEVKDLLEFRKTPEFKKIKGVLMEFGYDSPQPLVIFAIGNKKLIGQLNLAGFKGTQIEDADFLNQLIHFKCNNDAYSIAYGAALVYVVINDVSQMVLYVVPFDRVGKDFCGNDWTSSELPQIFETLKKKHGITWEE